MNKKIFVCFILVATMAVSASAQKTNSTVKAAATDKVTAKSARSEYHHGHHGFEHHFPHYHGGHHLGGYGHHKEFDQYLIPLLVVLGMGVLILPMISVFMTTLVGNVPVTTLVSGRRKREVTGPFITEEKVTDIIKRLSKALEAFNAEDK